MSWTDEEIDALVREAANAQKIAYKDAYWHEMEAMLGAPKKRRIAGWWWFGTASVVLIGAALGFNLVRTDVNADTKLAITSPMVETNQRNDLKTTKFSDNQAKLSDLNTSVGTSEKTSVSNYNGMTSVEMKTKTAFKKSNVETSPFACLTGSSLPNHEINKTLGLPSEILAPSVLEEIPNVVDEEKESPEIADNRNFMQVSTMDLLSVPEHKEHALNKSPIDLPLFMAKRFGFFASVSGGMGQSYIATDARNIMYQFGINGGVEFFKRSWTLGAGLGYRQQFVNNLEMSYHRKYYHFGLMNVNQTLNYDQLLFADLNLFANYRFGRSEVGLQVTPTYMLGARLNYTEDREDIVGQSVTYSSIETEKNQFVSSPNFNSFGVNLGLTYSFKLNKNLLIQTNLSSRLSNGLLKGTFVGEERNFPLLFELGIKKRF